MGYALFAQRKLVLTGQLNLLQLMQTQRSDEQFCLATKQTSLKQQLSSLAASQSMELADLYEELSECDGTDERAEVNALIQEKQEEFKQEEDRINRQVYQVSIKESAIQMEVKRLDTQVTAIQKQLEAIEQAEGKEIDSSTPKFSGLG